MPYAATSDNVRLYFEAAGAGTPIIFLHEFAADHTNWEPQMRYFSRGHRCIAYSARGYTPSDVPASADVYTYRHFYTDALAVLDHLGIAKAHFVGLSMGSYSSLQIGLNAPQRALSMTLAAVGSGSALENLEAFRKQCRANAEQYETIGSVEVAKATREAPSRIPFLLKDPRGHADFYAALARHDARGSANTMRGFQGGRPSIFTLTDAIRKVADAGADHLRRRGRRLRRAEPVSEEAPAGGGAGVLPEVGPRAQSRGARAVQRDGRAVHRAGRSRPLAGARSEVDGGGLHRHPSGGAHFRLGALRSDRTGVSTIPGTAPLRTIPDMTAEGTYLAFPAAAEQEHALLAEHVPEPPRHVDPQRPAVEIERDGAFHLDVDLVAELHEILDGAEMDVRRVVPGGRQVLGARHVAADQKLQPHPPEAEIRERDDGAPADPQQILQHHARLPRRLQRLRQDHIVEGVVGIVDEVGVGVALHHRQPLGDAAVDALARQLDAAAVDAAALQELQRSPSPQPTSSTFEPRSTISATSR